MLATTIRLGQRCPTKVSVAMFSVPNFDFKDPIKEQTEKLVARKPVDSKRGRVQSWKQPVYYAPHQHVFEQTPDFSFQDGRAVHVTSQKQLNYKLDQIRLAKKIVELLNENDEVERVYKEELKLREQREHEELSKRPKAKGEQAIC